MNVWIDKTSDPNMRRALLEMTALTESLSPQERATVVNTPEQVRVMRMAGMSLTLTEVGILFGYSRGWVSLHQERAMKKLRDRIKSQGDNCVYHDEA